MIIGLGGVVIASSGDSGDYDGVVAQAAFDSAPENGGPRAFNGAGTSLPTGSLQPHYSVNDVSINTSLGPVALGRQFTASTAPWKYVNARRSPRMPSTPFGKVTVPGSDPPLDSLQWWHNYYSYVLNPQPTLDDEYPNFVVRDQTGAAIEFPRCEVLGAGAEPCWASGGPESKYRLHIRDGGYDLYQPGRRLVFEALAGHNTFLSAVQDEQGRTMAAVTYGGAACGLQDAGVPYIASIRTADGQLLKFSYESSTTPCLIDHVDLAGAGSGGTDLRLVQYSYALPDSGTSLMTSAYWPQSDRHEFYSYPDGGFEVDERYGSDPANARLITKQSVTGVRVTATRLESQDEVYTVDAGHSRDAGSGLDYCLPGQFVSRSRTGAAPRRRRRLDEPPWSTTARGGSRHGYVRTVCLDRRLRQVA